MKIKELLSISRDLKANNCTDIREYLEMVQTFDDNQQDVFYTLIKNCVDIERAIQGVYGGDYCTYDNFKEYIDNYIDEYCGLPDFIELDYISMWYRTFRYDDNLIVDWQEFQWCKDRNEYGTEEQKKQQREYIEYNLQYSQFIDFYC